MSIKARELNGGRSSEFGNSLEGGLVRPLGIIRTEKQVFAFCAIVENIRAYSLQNLRTSLVVRELWIDLVTNFSPDLDAIRYISGSNKLTNSPRREIMPATPPARYDIAKLQ